MQLAVRKVLSLERAREADPVQNAVRTARRSAKMVTPKGPGRPERTDEMSFHEARNAFDDSLRFLQNDPSIGDSTYGKALIQLVCAMIELTNAMDAGFAEVREDLTTVEGNLKDHVSQES